MKKRKLYRQLTGSEGPWFPHDNDMELLKEFCWEAAHPRWVFHGTPASGAGILGCLESGSSVVAVCFDDHHRTHLRKCLKERAVESLVVGSAVFREETLQARALELNVGAEKKKKSEKKIKDIKDNKEDNKEAAERKKERKSKKSKKAASSEDSSKADSSSEESSSDESSPSKKKKKKKNKAD